MDDQQAPAAAPSGAGEEQNAAAVESGVHEPPGGTDLAGKRIAIIMMSAIGDAVHVLPLVNSIKAVAPDSHITWIVQPGPHALVEGHPAVDEFLVFHRKRGLGAFREIRGALRKRSFDLAIAPQVYFKAGVVTAMTRAPRKIGFDRARARDLNWLFTNERIPPHAPQHVQDQYLEFLEYLGVPPVLEWGLGPTAEERERYAKLLPPHKGPTVAFVVGTSKPEKEWPALRYAQLADRLHTELGARVVLVGGKSERELAAAGAVRTLAENPPESLLEWDLRRLVYLLDEVDVLVSPDTGPLHIAVALNTPSVALMGYTNPRRVGPYRRFGDLLVDAYGEPGEDYPVSAEYRSGRMERIGVDEVMRRVQLALERYPRSERKGHSAP